jgi:hypothetical protein
MVTNKGKGSSLAPLSKKAGEAKRREIKELKVALKSANERDNGKVKVK